MSTNLKLLDSFKLTGHLNRNLACGLSRDDRVFVISDLGLYIISQKPNLNCVFPEYMFHKYFLKASDFALCDNVDIDINSFIYELPKDVLYESVAYVELTQNLKGTTPTQHSIIYAQWSDSNMVDGYFSMLGVLTNIYSLEIYVKSVNESNITEYKMILNLTNQLIERSKVDFVYSIKMPPLQKVRELKKRVEHIAPIQFEWSHSFTYDNQNCSVIFIGHIGGGVSIWRIFHVESSNNNVQNSFLCRYQTKMGNISAFCWHQTTEYGGALCIGDSDGKILILQVKNLDRKECSVENEVEIFSVKDRQVDKIVVMTFDTYTILIAVKQSYLLVFGVDLSGQVFDFTVHNVNNFYITGITHKNNIAKVLTFTGVFKELRLSVHFNKIIIEDLDIPVKFDFSGYRSHGFIESSNKIMFAFFLNTCRLKNSIRGKKFINVCIFTDINLSPLKLLLENKSGTLRASWDCLETLRLTCLKEQRFPWLGLSSNLELDCLSLVELKKLRLVAKLSETVFVVVKRVVSYEIKPYILLHYLVDIKLILQRLAKLFKERDTGKKLSIFQLRSINLQVFFLKEMVISGILPKAQVGNTFLKEITHILAKANEIKYPNMLQCIFCGEKLIGSMCLPPHADSRCAFTMMPIFLAPAFKCALCNSLAHSEVTKEQESIFCPYCDYPMERVCLNKKILEDMNNFGNLVFNENEILSKCFSDCVRDCQETVQDLYLHLEDNEVAVCNISDDEEDVEKNEFTKLYFRLSNITMNSRSTDANNETSNY